MISGKTSLLYHRLAQCFVVLYTNMYININLFKPEPLSSSSTTSRELLPQLVLDENNLKWMANKKKSMLIFKKFHENFSGNQVIL